MASLPFWRKCEIFLRTPGTCVHASSRGVVRGLGQLNMAAARVDNAIRLSAEKLG